MESLLRGAAETVPPQAGEKAGEGDLSSFHEALQARRAPPRADPSQAGLSRALARSRRGEAGRGCVPAPLLPGDADSNSACPAAQTASSFPLRKAPALLSALREVADT